MREVVAGVPLDRILLETDAPYMAPTPFRGQTCHPGMVPRIAAARRSRSDVPSSESSTRVAPTPVASTASSTSTSNRTRYLVDLYRFTVVSIVIHHHLLASSASSSRPSTSLRGAPHRSTWRSRASREHPRARVSAPSVAMTTSSSTTTRERLVVTMMTPPTPPRAPTPSNERARAAGVRFIILVRNRLRDRPGETRDRRLRVAVGVRRPGGDDLDDDLRARVAHATGEPGIVRDRVSIGLHHDGIFTRVSPGASGGAVWDCRTALGSFNAGARNLVDYLLAHAPDGATARVG